MNYAQFRKYDIANGPGVRATLFVSGCTHNCPGCFNKDYFDFNSGTPWNIEIENEIINHLKTDDVATNMSILGGEPFQQTNDDDLYNFIKRIKTETNATIWIYSGYTMDRLILDDKKLRILELCDVLVDGRFIEELKDPRLEFRGSKNQRIINIKKSLDEKQIIEYNTTIEKGEYKNEY